MSGHAGVVEERRSDVPETKARPATGSSLERRGRRRPSNTITAENPSMGWPSGYDRSYTRSGPRADCRIGWESRPMMAGSPRSSSTCNTRLTPSGGISPKSRVLTTTIRRHKDTMSDARACASISNDKPVGRCGSGRRRRRFLETSAWSSGLARNISTRTRISWSMSTRDDGVRRPCRRGNPASDPG